MLLVAGTGAACASEGAGPDPTGPTGEIRLILTGLHSSATSGGTATAIPVGGGANVTVDIPASGDQSRTVPVGVYSVSYNPPGNHRLASGSTPPATVTISEDETTTVALTLEALGTLQVNVTGLTGSAANGGNATAQRTGGAPVAIPVSVAGTGAAIVPIGAYAVTYTPPTGFSTTTTNPLTGVDVAYATASPASFGVTAESSTNVGTIHVTITGLGTATSGGNVSARLTDNSGNTYSATLSTPSGGSSSTDLTNVPVGAYNVTYSAPSGYRTADINPKVVNVTANATASTSFTAEVRPAGGVLFESDWSTARGTTTNALGDGGKWPDVTADGMLEVVATTGLGFPATMANCLKVRLPNGGESADVRVAGAWAVPQIGEKLFYRMYFRNDIANDQGNQSVSFHPWEFNAGEAAFHFEFTTDSRANGTCWCRFRFEQMGDPWDRVVPGSPEILINKFETYRLEMMFERTGTNQWLVEIRIYDDSDALIYDPSNMYNKNGSQTLAAYNAAGGRFTMNAEYTDEMLVGSSGGMWNFTADQFIYWAGFMVRSDNWCGAY